MIIRNPFNATGSFSSGMKWIKQKLLDRKTVR